jgi:hypothetical protein
VYKKGRQPFGGLTVPEAGLIQNILKEEQIFIDALLNTTDINDSQMPGRRMQAIPQPVHGGTICENVVALRSKIWK